MGLGMASEHFLRFVSGDFDLKFCSKLRRRNILSKFYYFPVPRVGNLAKTLQTSKKKINNNNNNNNHNHNHNHNHNNNHMLHLLLVLTPPPPHPFSVQTLIPA